MSAEKTMLLVLKGAISELPPEDQEKIKAVANTLKSIILSNGDAGMMAFALLGAEMAVEQGGA